MKKLRLDLERLEVESFATVSAAGAGTVGAHDDTVLKDPDTTGCNNTEYTCSCGTDCVAGSCDMCSGVQYSCGPTYCGPTCGMMGDTCTNCSYNPYSTCSACTLPQGCEVSGTGCPP